ncbi:MAG TPA: Maf family protein [Syntrophomonadaceae bacterium]|nr:Maf family protein [Syntrophomonadaceae bacterium]HNX28249.1 Maf family protein [Syntrophomonadaceae bacterium]HPR92456.1 Maf family protein [Syntrophomonadaceae bacterium]
MTKIILASASPRRIELLKTLGLDFICIKPETEEQFIAGETACQAAERLAVQKADSIKTLDEDSLIISADTVVLCDGKILGKPENEAEARTMLTLLSGRSHKVITAVCLKNHRGEIEVQSEITAVFFRNLSQEEITGYIATGEPFDKAGGYGIQGKGAVLVDRIEGCYFNVVGLPLGRLYDMLKKQNVEVLGV